MEAFVRITPEIYRLAVPFTGCWTGVTLVLGEENVLVDTGACAETVDSAIVPALEQLGLSLKDITWLAMTHIHGDHVGGMARLRELAPHLRVAAFVDSRDRLREPLVYSKAIRAKFPEHSPGAPAVLEGRDADLLLKDGDCVGALRLIHTPGHDTDSCCYFDERSNTLITGDSLQLNGTVTQGCALLMDANGYEKALHRLLGMQIDNIVCGHPYLPLGPEAIGREASLNYLIACHYCFARDEGFVQGMMSAGVDDPVVIAKALIREVGGVEPAKLFLPLYTVTEMMNRRSNKQ